MNFTAGFGNQRYIVRNPAEMRKHSTALHESLRLPVKYSLLSSFLWFYSTTPKYQIPGWPIGNMSESMFPSVWHFLAWDPPNCRQWTSPWSTHSRHNVESCVIQRRSTSHGLRQLEARPKNRTRIEMCYSPPVPTPPPPTFKINLYYSLTDECCRCFLHCLGLHHFSTLCFDLSGTLVKFKREVRQFLGVLLCYQWFVPNHLEISILRPYPVQILYVDDAAWNNCAL